MRYKNKRTGTVINIESQLIGEEWQEVKTSKPSPKKSTAKKDEE